MTIFCYVTTTVCICAFWTVMVSVMHLFDYVGRTSMFTCNTTDLDQETKHAHLTFFSKIQWQFSALSSPKDCWSNINTQRELFDIYGNSNWRSQLYFSHTHIKEVTSRMNVLRCKQTLPRSSIPSPININNSKKNWVRREKSDLKRKTKMKKEICNLA